MRHLTSLTATTSRPMIVQLKPKSTRTVRFWALPILVTLTVLSALAAFYLGGILQPMTNLRHFPVAILNEDAGPTGAQVVKGMLAGFDHDAYDVRVLDHNQAKTQLDSRTDLRCRGHTAELLLQASGLREKRVDAGPGRAGGHHRVDESARRHAGRQYRRPDAAARGGDDRSARRPTAFARSCGADRQGPRARRRGLDAGQPGRSQVDRAQRATRWHRQRAVRLLLRPAAGVGRLHREHRGQQAGGFHARHPGRHLALADVCRSSGR